MPRHFGFGLGFLGLFRVGKAPLVGGNVSLTDYDIRLTLNLYSVKGAEIA
jgi:hypothetical protein